MNQIGSEEKSSMKEVRKKNRKLLIWILSLLILLLGGGLLLVLKSSESTIDYDVQEKYAESVGQAEKLENKGYYKDALEEYEEANELLNDEVLIKKITSLKLIIKIKEDSSAWEIAKEKNTIKSYNYYINSFAEGEYISDAKAALVTFEPQVDQNYPEAIREPTLKGQDAAVSETTRQDVEQKINKILTEIFNNMVNVSGGTFTMGCINFIRPGWGDCEEDEQPAHDVYVSGFAISKYEVTQAQWKVVMGNNPSKFDDCPNCPVESVTWKEVQDFIGKLNLQTGMNYRLPTESEWEYAARGGHTKGEHRFKYVGSDNIDEVAWHARNSEFKTSPIGQKQPNVLGLYDMSGNVSEFCQDWYGKGYYLKRHSNDPQGPSSGTVHVTRGGNSFAGGIFSRVTERSYLSPKYERAAFLGFRLAL
ncbi:formylglycine-generating enzyme family protein [Ekhidna sp.]|uniref:formylglycine-generating enzyme family protein n=1 Tax=Ekhidna sp. TaxID=2608089 RepID=UPI00329969C7